jgi:thioredoxin reductase (NADPH)
MPRIAMIVIISDDERQREDLRADLEHRFGSDYEVVACGSPSAEGDLSGLVGEGASAAAVIAAVDLPATGRTGVDVLRGVRSRHATARRILLVERGEWRDHPVRQAMVLGEVDSYLFVPWSPRERWLFQPMSEYLADWSLTQPPDHVAVTIVGERWDEASHHLRDIFSRASVPYEFLAPTSDAGRAVLAAAGEDGTRLPIARFHSGHVLVQPTDTGIVDALGFRAEPVDVECDVAIVGGGPGGLSAAVYAASEGLRTVLLDPSVPGGQAGASSMIRNYLGFPRGVSGAELMIRAVEQAWLFGAELLLAREAVSLAADGDKRVVTTDIGDVVRARAVVIATGVSWRRLKVPALEALVGSGVFYGAATAEADVMTGRRVYVLGGGNSAGQAAVYLARSAEQVTILIRRAALAETMSDYLIREIDAHANIAVRPDTQIVDGGGGGRLEHLVLRSIQTGEQSSVPADALFVMIGAEPRTDWLAGVIARDQQGYLLTGAEALRARTERGRPQGSGLGDAFPARDVAPDQGFGRAGGPPGFVETSMPGVFAVGDVRSGATKRVSSSVGSGAIAIQLVHDYLAGPRA